MTTLNLHSCASLHNDLVHIVAEYARPRIIGIVDTIACEEMVIQGCVPLLSAIVVTNFIESKTKRVEEICDLAGIPCKRTTLGISDYERVELINITWGDPDFICWFQRPCYDLSRVVLQPGWEEQLVSLDLKCWHSISNGRALALYPPAEFLRVSFQSSLDSDEDDDYNEDLGKKRIMTEEKQGKQWSVVVVSPPFMMHSHDPALYSTVAVRFPVEYYKKMDIFNDRVAPEFNYEYGIFKQEGKSITWFFMSSCWDKKIQQGFINKVKETIGIRPEDVWTVDRFIMTSGEITPRVCQHPDCHVRSQKALRDWEERQGLS